MKNGKIVKIAEGEDALPPREQGRVYSIITYLGRHNGLGLVRPWFSGLDIPWFRHLDVRDRAKILKVLGSEKGYRFNRADRFRYHADRRQFRSVRGYDQVVGPVSLFHFGGAGRIKNSSGGKTFDNGLSMTFSGHVLEFTDRAGQTLSFSFLETAQKLVREQQKLGVIKQADRKRPMLWMEKKAGTLRIALGITHINGTLSPDGNGLKHSSVSVLIFLAGD